MYRGKVTKIDAKGAYVQTAEYGTLGPCQWANSRPVVGASVLVADVGSESQPDLIVIGAIGTTAGAVVSAELSNNADVNLQTAGVNRWTFRKSADTESGGNAGSNLAIVRRSDAGAQLSLALTFWRATGKITVGDVGVTAGIELGSGGPTITVSTGAPSHTPPNGSVHLRTDGTASTTLYVRAAGTWTALS